MFQPISVDAARRLIREKSPVILDVRDASAFREAHLPNAIQINLPIARSLVDRFGRDQPLLVYCQRGRASAEVAARLLEYGFREVYSLEGGFEAWRVLGAEIQGPAAEGGVVRPGPLADWLLREGGNPDDANVPLADGTLPLIKACQAGRADLVEALIEAGADLGGLDRFGNDALWAACYNGDPATISALLKAGIDLNRRNPGGATALIYAASAGKTAVVAFLLEAGADPLIETEDDFTALDLAANIEILRLLKPVTIRSVPSS